MMFKPACVWNWDVLLYEYYIIPTDKPDLGGFGVLRGISSRTGSAEGASIAFDDAIPELPEAAIEVGSGLVCVGELYSKAAGVGFKKMDFSKQDMIDSSLGRVLEIFEKANEPRRNPSPKPTQKVSTTLAGNQYRDADQERHLYYVPDDKASTIFEAILPVATGVGLGVALYRYVSDNVRLQDVVLIWGAGAAVGLALGQELRRSKYISRG